MEMLFNLYIVRLKPAQCKGITVNTNVCGMTAAKEGELMIVVVVRWQWTVIPSIDDERRENEIKSIKMYIGSARFYKPCCIM